MPDEGLLADVPQLSEHAQYLSDTNLLAMLEMGLQSVLLDLKNDKKRDVSDESPINYLATWLMRHNPRHSKEGQEMLDIFAAQMGAREPLDDLSALEETQQIEAAVKLQAASRGHSARMMAGEQKRSRAATAVQSAARGRATRKVQAEVQAEKQKREQDQAATTVQARIRGRHVRSAPGGSATGGMESEPPSAAEAQEEEAAAAALDGEEEHAAATRVQAMHRGRAARRG